MTERGGALRYAGREFGWLVGSIEDVRSVDVLGAWRRWPRISASRLPRVEEIVFNQFKRRSAEQTSWTRTASDPDDLREYDAFGPWLLQIRNEADMPRRFRSVYDAVKDADFLIKIPRSIERRDAYPGCDLYKSVFAADADGFSFFTALDDEVSFTTREVAWEEVAAVRKCHNLLKAEFVLLLNEGDELVVPYSSVSTDLIARVTAFARQHLIRPSDFVPVSVNQGEEFEDFFFNVMLAEERRGGQFMMPIHFDEPGRSCRNAQNRRRVSTGTLILLSGSELVVVDRDIPMKRRFFAHYAHRQTYISLPSVKAFRLRPCPDNIPGHFMVLELILDQQRIAIPCFKEPIRVIDVLRRRGVAQL